MKDRVKALLTWFGGAILISLIPCTWTLRLLGLNAITGGLVIALIEKIKEEVDCYD